MRSGRVVESSTTNLTHAMFYFVDDVIEGFQFMVRYELHIIAPFLDHASY